MDRGEYLLERFNTSVSGSGTLPVHVELHQQGLCSSASGYGVDFYVDAGEFDPTNFDNKTSNDEIQYGVVCEGCCFREGLVESFDEDGFSQKLFKTRRSEVGARWTSNSSKLTAFPNCFKNFSEKGPACTAVYFLTAFPLLTDVITSLGVLGNYLCCCGTIVQVKRKIRNPTSGRRDGEILAGPWKQISVTESLLKFMPTDLRGEKSALLSPESDDMKRESGTKHYEV